MPERGPKVLKVTSGVLREEISTPGIIKYIEGLVAEERGFPLYQTLPEQLDIDNFPIIQNPLLAYCGLGTLPVLANPDSKRGAIAVVPRDKKLVYDPQGQTPPEWRDRYRWSSPYNYYIDPNFNELLQLFKEEGYSLWESTDGFQFVRAVFHGEDFSIGSQLDYTGIEDSK